MISIGHARGLALDAAQAAADKGATDVLVLDVSERLPLTDCFVIVTGSNERQVGAIVDAVGERLAASGVKPLRREGERDGRWVLLDFGDIVVHVQHAEERVFYALDKLWGDCPVIPFVDSALPVAAGIADGERADGGVAAEGAIGDGAADGEGAASGRGPAGGATFDGAGGGAIGDATAGGAGQ